MSPKVAHPMKEQAELIKEHGLMPFVYAVLHENEQTLTVVNRINGVVRDLKKEGFENEH